MRIAIVNIFRLREGSGDGMTEYAYQLYTRLKKKHKVDAFYALEKSKRVDIPGRVYAETFFRFTAKKLLAGNYDIVHIVNPEIGFFAKALKKAGSRAKIVVTIHDFVRVAYLRGGGSNSWLQSAYDRVVTRNTADAISYADLVIFTSSHELAYAKSHYRLPRNSLIFIGAKDAFLEAPLPRRKRIGGLFRVGYVGGLIKSRNIPFILQTADALGTGYRFQIYGSGAELPELLKYKKKKRLQNVEFMGFAPEKELLKIYDRFDAFMSCSYVDVASLPIEDALARGLPVIAAKRNIYDEELRRRIFEAETPTEAAQIIRRLQKEGYLRSRQRANIKYGRSISWEQVAKRTESVYLKLLSGRKAPRLR